jgi:hypothetical protein
MACLERYQAVIRARVLQCRIPAPTLKELRWKQKIEARHLDTEARAAIVADCQRLEPARN